MGAISIIALLKKEKRLNLARKKDGEKLEELSGN